MKPNRDVTRFERKEGIVVVVDLVVSLATIAVSGIVAGLVGYFFGLRTARKQRLHEIKQRAYVEMLPPIQELIEIIGWIHDFRGLNLADDDQFVGHLVRLIAAPFALGDRETIYDIEELVAEYEGKESKRARQDFLEAVHDRITTGLLLTMYRDARELRRHLTALSITPPHPVVKTKIDEILSMLSADESNFAIRNLLKTSGLAGLLPEIDMTARAGAYTKVLNELREAIEAELKKTL